MKKADFIGNDKQIYVDKLEISKEDITKLPMGRFHGRITVVSSRESADKAIGFLSRSRFLGFDTETRPCFKKGEHHKVSLIQLASETHAYLFRINILGMPPSLRWLLETEKVIKIGQDVRQDLKALKKECGVQGRGFIDLMDITKKLECSPRSVKGLAALFLGIRISKSAQTSNWERQRLNLKQKMYAAMDAWICLEVYKSMLKRKLVRPA